LKRSIVWSGVAVLAFSLLQVYGIRRQGLGWEAVFSEAHYWLWMWPGFFLTIFVFTGGWRKDIHTRAHLAAERWLAEKQADAQGGSLPSASCPRCGALNPTIEVSCQGCGLTLRHIEFVEPLEQLAGAKHSVPSVLYVAAVLASFGVGALTLFAIGEERFLENTALMIGGFMGGAAVSLTLFVFAISRWAQRKYGR
jgi:hypothetical protein